eukprot:1995520-Rhodomonas_salina.2
MLIALDVAGDNGAAGPAGRPGITGASGGPGPPARPPLRPSHCGRLFGAVLCNPSPRASDPAGSLSTAARREKQPLERSADCSFERCRICAVCGGGGRRLQVGAADVCATQVLRVGQAPTAWDLPSPRQLPREAPYLPARPQAATCITRRSAQSMDATRWCGRKVVGWGEERGGDSGRCGLNRKRALGKCYTYDSKCQQLGVINNLCGQASRAAHMLALHRDCRCQRPALARASARTPPLDAAPGASRSRR